MPRPRPAVALRGALTLFLGLALTVMPLAPVAALPTVPEPGLEQAAPDQSGTDLAGEVDLEAELADPVDPAAAADPANPNRVYPCTGYGALPRYNTVATNRANVYNWYIFPSTKVGNGAGNINWTLNPHRDLGWKLWFSSLRWLGPSIEAGRSGDTAALATAETIIRDWIKDHGSSWRGNTDHMEANTHRLNVLTCFREVVMERNGGKLPSSYGWLTQSLHLHAQHNMARWSGAHNHGSMENRALLGLGCLLGRRDYQDHAIARVKKALPQQVTREGLSNEAAPGYMHFNYRLLSAISDLMERCGHDATAVSRPLTAMGNNLAHLTNGLGYYWQYGDSEYTKAPSNVPAQAVYAATNGRQGTKPSHRVRRFEAGFVFGRSSWGTPQTGFANNPSWMLRGGTGRERKAHRGDLLEFLYTARGRDIIVDGGHPGIVSSKWRGWALGELAHNTIFVPSAKMSAGGRATVTRSHFPANGRADFVEMTQRFNSKGTRTRGALIMPDPDIAVVLDRTVINDPGKRHTVQSLWSVPTDERATVVNRSTVRSSRPGGRSQTTFMNVPFWGAPAAGKGETVVYRGAEQGVPRGHYYPKQQQRQPTDQVTFSRHGNRIGTISVIAPALKSHQVKVTKGTYANGSTKLTIRVGAKTTVVRITQGGYLSRER